MTLRKERKALRFPIPNSVRTLLIGGFGLLIVIFGVVIGISAWQNEHARSDAERLEVSTRTALVLEDAKFSITLADLFLERYVISGSEILVPLITLNIEQASAGLQEAERLEQSQGAEGAQYDAAELAGLESSLEGVATYASTAEQVIQLRQEGDLEGARALMETTVPQITAMGQQIGSAADSERDELPPLRTEASQTRQTSFWLLVVLGTTGTILAMGAAAVITRTIVRPLTAVESAARAIANGDLEARADVGGPAEIAYVGQSADRMADSLLERIKEREAAYEDLRKHEEWLTLAQTAAGIGMFYWDVSEGSARFSDDFFRLFGMQPAGDSPNLAGWLERFHEEDRGRAHDLFRRVLKDGAEGRADEFRVVWPDGSTHWISFHGRAILDDAGRTSHMAGAVVDIDERKRAEEEAKHRAFHDALTGLPNRMLFRDRSSIALAQAMRSGSKVAMAAIDLDRLKVLNDTLGHAAGDELLKSAAVRLAGSIRQGDTVARTGGDQFAVMITGCDTREEGLDTMSRIVDAFRTPFRLAGREINVSASVGVSCYTDDGLDLETLMKNADTALHYTKRDGGDGVQVYSRSMQGTTVDRLDLETDLRQALQRGEVKVHYQPVVSVQSGEIVGVEALARWTHPKRGPIPPDVFIPLAEETGQIVTLGEHVLREACTQAKAWVERGVKNITVAVNVSMHQFHHNDFSDRVGRTLEDSALPARHLELEVTESTAMRNPGATREVLERLSGMGIRFSIDDFGTGHSSLEHLSTLPIHRLKIDRSFICNLPENPKDAAIALSVINLAHGLGLSVIAEGVETEEQLEFLRERGCDYFQGYLHSKPQPADQIHALLKGEQQAAAEEALSPHGP